MTIYSGYESEHAPIGPVAVAGSTPLAQCVPTHWYQTLSEAAWTQVRGGTLRPSVADEHHA